MAQHSWHPPLPPGWEARWDPNQKAFFYIDHSNKTTSWEDPRWANRQKLATPATGSHGGGHSGGHYSGSHGEAIPMRDMSHASPQRSPQRSTDASSRRSRSPAASREETTFTNQQEAEAEVVAARLRTRFPDAGPVIKDVLAMCQNDEDEAASQLMQLGFESKDSLPRASPAHGRGKQSTSASPNRSTSTTPKRTTSPAAIASPAKPKVSDAEKTKRKNKLAGEFTSLESEVITMALEACDYDVDRTRTMLDRVAKNWATETSRANSRSQTSSAGTSRSSRPASAKASTEPVSLEPVVFSNDRPSPSRTTTTTSVTSRKRTSSTTTPKPRQQHQQQQRAKHVTKNQTRQQGSNEVVTRQPRSQPSASRHVPVMSGGSGLAQGPNPALRVGPDVNFHLGPDPSHCMGANNELCDGPNPDLLFDGSVGADGPNPEYHQGNVAYLVTGSMGATGANPMLRCAAEHSSLAPMNHTLIQTSV